MRADQKTCSRIAGRILKSLKSSSSLSLWKDYRDDVSYLESKDAHNSFSTLEGGSPTEIKSEMVSSPRASLKIPMEGQLVLHAPSAGIVFRHYRHLPERNHPDAPEERKLFNIRQSIEYYFRCGRASRRIQNQLPVDTCGLFSRSGLAYSDP